MEKIQVMEFNIDKTFLIQIDEDECSTIDNETNYDFELIDMDKRYNQNLYTLHKQIMTTVCVEKYINKIECKQLISFG